MLRTEQRLTKKLNDLRIPAEVHRALKIEAAKRRVTMQQLHRQLLVEALLPKKVDDAA